mmetsp:Transcript_17089/g.48641  ORF Transcript_17089/g.48641 Transcript_17089/m.48641 type:complete len:233 (-) Transcript_17089:330-1028(-)
MAHSWNSAPVSSISSVSAESSSGDWRGSCSSLLRKTSSKGSRREPPRSFDTRSLILRPPSSTTPLHCVHPEQNEMRLPSTRARRSSMPRIVKPQLPGGCSITCSWPGTSAPARCSTQVPVRFGDLREGADSAGLLLGAPACGPFASHRRWARISIRTLRVTPSAPPSCCQERSKNSRMARPRSHLSCSISTAAAAASWATSRSTCHRSLSSSGGSSVAGAWAASARSGCSSS